MCKFDTLRIEIEKLSKIIDKKMEGVICLEDLHKDIEQNLSNICDELSDNLLPGKRQWIDNHFLDEMCSMEFPMSCGRKFVTHHIDLVSEEDFCFYMRVDNERKMPLFSICVKFKYGIIRPIIFTKSQLENALRENSKNMLPGHVVETGSGGFAIAIQKQFETKDKEYWSVLVGNKMSLRYAQKPELK